MDWSLVKNMYVWIYYIFQMYLLDVLSIQQQPLILIVVIAHKTIVFSCWMIIKEFVKLWKNNFITNKANT